MATKKTGGKVAAKVAEKVGKAKAKITKKCGRVAKAIVLLLVPALILVGCATSEPASRATCATYGDIVVKVGDNVTNTTVTLTIGDGAIASADSTGSTETMTANPTNDVKPKTEVAVGVGGSSAGVGQGGGSSSGMFQKIGAAVDAAGSLLKSDESDSGAKAKADSASGDCPDGNCKDTDECEDCVVR